MMPPRTRFDQPRWMQCILQLSRTVTIEQRRRLVCIPDRTTAEKRARQAPAPARPGHDRRAHQQERQRQGRYLDGVIHAARDAHGGAVLMKRGLDAHFQRMEEMSRERIVTFSKSLNRWCVCNGFGKILATAATREEAERLMQQELTAQQLPLL